MLIFQKETERIFQKLMKKAAYGAWLRMGYNVHTGKGTGLVRATFHMVGACELQ